jgi:hypothetical protein
MPSGSSLEATDQHHVTAASVHLEHVIAEAFTDKPREVLDEQREALAGGTIGQDNVVGRGQRRCGVCPVGHLSHGLLGHVNNLFLGHAIGHRFGARAGRAAGIIGRFAPFLGVNLWISAALA